MSAKASPRKAQPAVPLIKMACPSCQARVTVDPASLRRGKIQCPRCLNRLDPIPGEAGAAPPPPAPAPAVDAAAELHARIARLEEERAQRLALQSDLELLTAENTALKARVEGLQTERTALLRRGEPAATPRPPAAAGSLARDLQQVTAERDALAQKLREAESALADVGRIVIRMQFLEQRICDIGASYYRTLEQLQKLEKQQRPR